MSCPHSQLLSAYHDGELPVAQREQMEEHIAECPACSAELAELKAMSNLFAVSPRAQLSQLARYRIRVAAEALPQDQVIRLARIVRAIAACVLVAASIWLWNQSENGSTQMETVAAPPPQLEVAITTTEATQNMDATTSPAAAWYLADASSRSDYSH